MIIKNNKFRIGLDPRNLNKGIKRSHYQLPNFENFKSRLNDLCYFSKPELKTKIILQFTVIWILSVMIKCLFNAICISNVLIE